MGVGSSVPMASASTPHVAVAFRCSAEAPHRAHSPSLARHGTQFLVIALIVLLKNLTLMLAGNNSRRLIRDIDSTARLICGLARTSVYRRAPSPPTRPCTQAEPSRNLSPTTASGTDLLAHLQVE